MAAGAAGAASGKGLLPALRPEHAALDAPATNREPVAGRATAADDRRPADARPQASPEAANAADARARQRAQDDAQPADRRTAFAAAMDKARAPAQTAARAQRQAATQQAAARQAADAGVANASGDEAAAAAQSLAAQLAGTREAQVAADAARDAAQAGDGAATDSNADAHADPQGDPLGGAGAAVASLLGWLQPVQAAPGQQGAHGDGAGDGTGGEDDGQGEAGGIEGLRATAAAGAASGGTGPAQGTLQKPATAAAQVAGDVAAGPAVAMPGDAGAANIAATAASGTDALGPQPAGKSADGSNGADAYATRYGAAKPAGGAAPAGTAPQSPGFDAGQSIRSSAAAMATPVERSVPAPMGDRHWARALSTQVLLLANHKVESATLRLSPEHTGPVEVRIQMQDSTINLAFNATQADTRAALEQALPQLRAAFSGAGLALGQATVGQQMRQGSQFQHASPNGQAPAADHPEATAASVRPLGLLDEYA